MSERIVPWLTIFILVAIVVVLVYNDEDVAPKYTEVWPVQVREDGIGGKILLLRDKDMKHYEQTFNQSVWIKR